MGRRVGRAGGHGTVTSRATSRSVSAVTDPSDPHRDLAGVLHDVSNALTVLLGWVGEARAEGATPEATAYALGIVEQHARIARDLARHAIGAPRIEEQRDLSEVVHEVVAALAVEASRAGIKLVLHGGDASLKVLGALDVGQVLTNLVLNAIAHAPRGSDVEIAVSVDEAGCALVVSDHGPGVAEGRREAIFQGDSLRSGGAGVGLRHSRALARAWRGDVDLLAHEGKGARFRVTWPRASALPRPPTSAPRVGDLSGIHVLVVEDDAAVTQLLEAALEARGAEVAVAGSAAELASALSARVYDAALVDLSPIAADPAAALGSIRARCPEAALVLVTGNADRLPEAALSEPLELVRKPFEIREVLSVLSSKVAKRA